MPLQYEGIIAEHKAVRKSAGLFDVSHMGQLSVTGEENIAELQRVVSNDLERIKDSGQAQYSMLLNDKGGIEDDLIIYRMAHDELLLVVNAANKNHDYDLLKNVAVDVSANWAMLALQGPLAFSVLEDITGKNLSEAPAFSWQKLIIEGCECIVAITGYTGEEGCELLTDNEHVAKVWRALLSDKRVSPAGLGARDTLRLEAGFPLHGNDIDAEHDPISAGLAFAAPASVRDTGRGGKAHEALADIRSTGSKEKLVVLKLEERGIARAGATIFLGETPIGAVTSGTMSPMLDQAIAMGWVLSEHADIGTNIEVEVRTKKLKAKLVAKPFVKRGSFK